MTQFGIKAASVTQMVQKEKIFAVIQPDLSKLKSKKHSCTEENDTLYVVFTTLTLH